MKITVKEVQQDWARIHFSTVGLVLRNKVVATFACLLLHKCMPPAQAIDTHEAANMFSMLHLKDQQRNVRPAEIKDVLVCQPDVFVIQEDSAHFAGMDPAGEAA